MEVVESAVESQLVLGDRVDEIQLNADPQLLPDNAFDSPSPQIMTVADEADTLLQNKVESYLDECFADIDGTWEHGCPIGTRVSRIAEEVSGDSFAEVSNIEWELLQYPQVSVFLEHDPGQVREPALRLEEVGTTGLTVEVEGETESLECPLPVTFIQPHFDLNGELYLGPREEREGLEHNSGWHSDFPDWHECEVQ